MIENSSWRNKVLSFLGLTAIQTLVVIIVRFAQKDGKYDFNPAASLAIAEFVKLCISAFLHSRSLEVVNGESVVQTFMKPFHEANKTVYRTMIGLALLYAINNQLTFVILKLTDPGTLTLGKSTTPMLTALLNFVLFVEPLNKLQWASVVLQITGLVVVLYDPCGDSSRATGPAIFWIMIACSITSVTSVVNARVLKKENSPINVCNMVLYAFGVIFNLLLFTFKLTPTHQNSFFGGFTSFAPVMVIVCNSFVGVAITFVYKYGDAIVKTFAASASSAVLLYLSAALFGISMNMSQMAGSVTVFVTCYIYFSIAPLLNDLPNPDDKTSDPEEGEVPLRQRASLQRSRIVVGAAMLLAFMLILTFGANITGEDGTATGGNLKGSTVNG